MDNYTKEEVYIIMQYIFKLGINHAPGATHLGEACFYTLIQHALKEAKNGDA